MLGMPFDPKSEVLIGERLRPHWSRAGAIVFVTFRTHDSIPQSVLLRWDREKNDWMKRLGLPQQNWSTLLPLLSEKDQKDFHREFNRTREDFLDTFHGKCLLRQPELAKIVSDSLLHFDGDRYRMGDFVVMPNHVHLLAAFGCPEQMREQFDSWLHYTAVQINRQIGATGSFWQQEPFDHLVRSSEQYHYLREYIFQNPGKARLRDGEYLYRRYEP
ncbi:MAG: hypothetical protein JWN70_5189 [Planctomycetaceae bacterium]|nr:hypothetical protein [Planctomycetaceae bacterium]